ncbi:hypothetical protein SAMN05216511_1552 [Streptomyces sp. KS_16]|uniref:hypothetical protein n=1 Tax=Streptomyces sp. KS_16 TaxID=1855350 RepID=UPI000888C2F0|nr:hypothetical protein [Streptomyces sp. KS_16]PBC85688.1 hypothetical protein BX261_5711 [Streptomyces sp. 2321.6]SDR08593.1 hypothetical protein SAMN05216511_1552 [Streptomyces sp. KS_16]SED76094.1 hypothetical protein SAMN05428940_5737 [Streptomyces sp. 2133.1]SNC72509.1 hypothetical protein SAMN06272741_5638 [Streptomyces sp. 2114.4]
MDKKEAREALASADALASRIRRGARWHAPLVFLLGLVMMALTALYGLLIQPSVRYAVPVVLLLPLFALVIYTATRPVVPRHHRALYAVITATGGGVYALTVTLGTVLFSGEPLWWVPGAILCAVPFFLVGMLERKAVRTTESMP